MNNYNKTLATKIENEYVQTFGYTGKVAHITEIYSLLFPKVLILDESRSKNIIQILEARGWAFQK
jgi:DNA phosphorothioation-dependent restriction protein DptG